MNPIIQESKTLWIGDIDHWMDESYIASLFAGSGAVNSVKVIRDKTTGLPAGYGFVEFRDHSAANNVLATYNGKTIPGTNKSFKLNWGVFGGGTKPGGETAEKPERGERGERSSRFSSRFSSQQQQQQAPEPTPVQNKSAPPGPEHSIYVGELDASVNESVLTEFFQRRYRSVLGSKVITDPVTKQCKGFGFVKFSDNNEAQAAIREMQGSILRGRALKTSTAYTKNQTQDTTTTNLSSMMNPYAMLANNPMLLNTLGSLSGLGGMPGMAGMSGMAGMAGMGAYGAQNMQYGAYGAGMMGGQMMQGYGQAQGMYGYGGDMQQQQQQQQVYQAYGQQQVYGQPQQQVGQMGGNAFVGSYFDPLNQAGGGYQQYGVAQQGQPQMYGQDVSSYLPQQQQQQYNVYTPQSGGQVNVYGVQQQVYQAVDVNNNNLNVNQQQGDGQNGAENNGHGQVESVAAAGDEKENMEEEAGEEVMRYNTTCIGNSFHFDFINGEKINATL